MDRRTMLRVSLAGAAGAGLAGASMAAQRESEAPRGRAAADRDRPELARAVGRGIDYFKRRTEQQAPLCRALLSAIESRDLAAARRAYVASRPPYEEIEVHASAFEQVDRDIDARPYVFDDGELDPEFRGFHKIEALLYAYEDLDAALPYARRLVQSIEDLASRLTDRWRFSASLHFEGMIALATEVAAKKISSEEETWSDQSLVIFRHNWIGVYSQFEPFAAVLGEEHEVSRRVKEAYERAMATVEPHFAPGRVGATPYSRIRIRERREMADASNRLREALLVARDALRVD